MNIKRDIEMLEQGYLPSSLCYNINQTVIIDFKMLDYRQYKKSEYIFNKLPESIQNISGIFEYCEKLDKLSPLELIKQRQNEIVYLEDKQESIQSQE